MRVFVLAVAASVFVGCLASVPAVSRQGVSVRTGRNDPGPDYEEIGSVTATHGSGCGGFGTKGSYDGAYALIRNKASIMGARYVRIDFESEPHGPPGGQGCYVNEYVLRGVAYRLLRAGSPGRRSVASANERGRTGLSADGTERGQCYGNGTCNKGLVCLSDLCVRMPSEDGADDVVVDTVAAEPSPATTPIPLETKPVTPKPRVAPSNTRSVVLGSRDAVTDATPTLTSWIGRWVVVQLMDGAVRGGMIRELGPQKLYFADGNVIDLLNVVRVSLDD